MIRGHRILVTGGAGFIGSAIARRLLPGNKVIIFDNFRRNALRFLPQRRHRNLMLIEGDVLDREAVRRATEGVDTVLHLAAIAGVTSYYKMPLRTMEVNLIGTYHVLEALRGRAVHRFVDFSSSEIYGPHIFRASEDSESIQGSMQEPRWTYAISKLASEKLTWCYHRELGMPTCSVRPFNVYGPAQVGEGAVQIFIRRALAGKPIPVTGDGIQMRAWCYLDDVVDAVMRVLEREEAIGHAFNIGNPETAVTMIGLARLIRRLTGSKSRIVFRRHIGVDIDLRVPSIQKAKKLLGFSPKVPLEEGLRRTIAWYREHAI